jgi:hypothetical protein
MTTPQTANAPRLLDPLSMGSLQKHFTWPPRRRLYRLSRADNDLTVAMCSSVVMRPEGPAPKGQESLAQGLPWVSGNKRFALKGLETRTRSGSIGSEPILAVPGGPFRANSGGGITQGKPWAMLFWPLRATDWKRPNYRPSQSSDRP